MGGDLNVFPRPDDPFAPGDPLFPSDQLGPLYEPGLTQPVGRPGRRGARPSAYSYVFEGQAQTLDQLFVNGPLHDDLVQVRAAHVNADWPADFPATGPRPVRPRPAGRPVRDPARLSVTDVTVTEGNTGTDAGRPSP